MLVTVAVLISGPPIERDCWLKVLLLSRTSFLVSFGDQREMADSPSPCEEEDVNPSLWPEEGRLATALEADVVIRDAFREGPHASKWPGVLATGTQSVKAMALNARALEIIAEEWCPNSPYAKTVPIGFMRREAFKCSTVQPIELLNKSWILKGGSCFNIIVSTPTCTTSVFFISCTVPASQKLKQGPNQPKGLPNPCKVGILRAKVGKPKDGTMLHVDASGWKKLFSHGVRRFLSRAATRVPSQNWFILSIHFGNWISFCDY